MLRHISWGASALSRAQISATGMLSSSLSTGAPLILPRRILPIRSRRYGACPCSLTISVILRVPCLSRPLSGRFSDKGYARGIWEALPGPVNLAMLWYKLSGTSDERPYTDHSARYSISRYDYSGGKWHIISAGMIGIASAIPLLI